MFLVVKEFEPKYGTISNFNTIKKKLIISELFPALFTLMDTEIVNMKEFNTLVESFEYSKTVYDMMLSQLQNDHELLAKLQSEMHATWKLRAL